MPGLPSNGSVYLHKNSRPVHLWKTRNSVHVLELSTWILPFFLPRLLTFFTEFRWYLFYSSSVTSTWTDLFQVSAKLSWRCNEAVQKLNQTKLFVQWSVNECLTDHIWISHYSTFRLNWWVLFWSNILSSFKGRSSISKFHHLGNFRLIVYFF